MTDPNPTRLDRRRWLLGVLLGGCAGRATPAQAEDEVAALQAHAQKAGLGPFRVSETEHYLGIGDAPETYRTEALVLCKELATTYQKYFADKGFPFAFPARRLTVVALASQRSYAKFLGEDPGLVVGGHFDIESNRLVIFDFRPDAAKLGARAKRINTLTLVHEAIHQLSFNTGMLDRAGDVPALLSEGIAMYGELWTRDDPTFGRVQEGRLKVFEAGGEWLPVERLWTEDALFEEPATRDRAYAESWALVFTILKSRTLTKKLRAYLDAIRLRRDPTRRRADAEAHFGNLDALDRDLRATVRRLIGA